MCVRRELQKCVTKLYTMVRFKKKWSNVFVKNFFICGWNVMKFGMDHLGGSTTQGVVFWEFRYEIYFCRRPKKVIMGKKRKQDLGKKRKQVRYFPFSGKEKNKIRKK